MIKDKPKLDFRYLLTKLIVITYSKHPNHRSLKLEFDREAHSRTIGTTLKSLIEEQTGINEQAWKKVAPCLLIY